MQVLQPAVIVLARHHNIFQEEVIVMNQLNSIIVEGNLVRDAVLSEPAAGFKVCHFTIGVNRYYKNKNDEGVEEVSEELLKDFSTSCFNSLETSSDFLKFSIASSLIFVILLSS